MAEADLPPDLALDGHQIVIEADPLPRVKRGWMIAFVAVMIALAAIVAYGFGHFDAARWIPEEDAPPVVAPVRAAIREGELGGRVQAPRRIDYARIDERLGRLAQSEEMVGFAVAIVENGELSFVKGYGVTEAEGAAPVTVNTVFRWASLSKGVAATLLGELAEQKKLSLDDPVARYARSLKLPGGGERTVTIADLLSHRLGIVKNAYDDKLEGGEDPKKIRAQLGTLDPYCKPSTCHAYQNVAFDAASEIIERVTRQRYSDVARQMLFTPLGMASTSVTRAGLVDAQSWARPHIGRREMPVEEAYYRVPAAGGVNSSIFDLGIWMLAQMGQAPAILSPDVLGTIHEPRVKTERRRNRYDREASDAHYALGWRDSSYAGHQLIGHRGAVSGYRSLISFDPAAKAGVAVLWNSQSSRPLGIPNEVFDMLYQRKAEDWLELDGNGRKRG